MSIDITAVHCKMGKISNNLEKHGDEDVTAFAIPFTGVIVKPKVLNAIVGDEHFDRYLFDDDKGFRKPLEWTTKFDLVLSEKYEGAKVTLVLAGDQTLEFADCRLKDITPTAVPGGTISLSLQIQLLPGLGQENLLLQEYQGREIAKLVIADAKIAEKKAGKQADLPLSRVGEGEEPEQGVAPPPKARGRKRNGAAVRAH